VDGEAAPIIVAITITRAKMGFLPLVEAAAAHSRVVEEEEEEGVVVECRRFTVLTPDGTAFEVASVMRVALADVVQEDEEEAMVVAVPSSITIRIPIVVVRVTLIMDLPEEMGVAVVVEEAVVEEEAIGSWRADAGEVEEEEWMVLEEEEEDEGTMLHDLIPITIIVLQEDVVE
jgi:hypothetical protein